MINFFRLVLAGLAIAMAGLVSAVVTMRFAIHGAEVKVPDLQGLTVSEAVHRTANMGLNLGIDNKYYSVRCAGRPGAGAIASAWRHRAAGMAYAGDREPWSATGGDSQGCGPAGAGGGDRSAPRRAGARRDGADALQRCSAGHGHCAESAAGSGGVERPSVSLLVSTPAPTPAPALVMPQLVGMPLAAATALVVHAGLKVGPVQSTLLGPPPAPGGDRGNGSSGYSGSRGHGVEPDSDGGPSSRTRDDRYA